MNVASVQISTSCGVGWVVIVAFFRAGQNGWLAWFGDITVAGRTFPGSSLLLVGVLAVLALVLGWMWVSVMAARLMTDEASGG